MFETYDNFDPKSDRYEGKNNNNKMNENELFLNESKKTANKAELTCHGKVQRLLKSHHFHSFVIVLVVIDCLCVALELLIEFMEQSLPNKEKNFTAKLNNEHQIHSNHSTQNFTHSKSDSHHSSDFHHILEIVELVLKYISLTILGVFVIELVIKLIFIPRNFIESKFEIFDAFVVLVSFSINIVLFHFKHVIYSVGALLTILRLWRITEIVNGTIVAVKEKHEKEIEKLKSYIDQLEEENRRLIALNS